jgi:hypothetical protein
MALTIISNINISLILIRALQSSLKLHVWSDRLAAARRVKEQDGGEPVRCIQRPNRSVLVAIRMNETVSSSTISLLSQSAVNPSTWITVVSYNKTDNVLWRNIYVWSCNHCCNGEAIGITYCECIFVALGNQHATRMRRIKLSSDACPALPYSTSPHTRYDFREKCIEHKLCVFPLQI